MKEHLSKSGSGFIACGRSGRGMQSKGLVLGLPPKSFANVPVENRCKRCQAVFASLNK